MLNNEKASAVIPATAEALICCEIFKCWDEHKASACRCQSRELLAAAAAREFWRALICEFSTDGRVPIFVREAFLRAEERAERLTFQPQSQEQRETARKITALFEEGRVLA